MAAVEVTISGVLYDKIQRTTQPVVLIGEATLTGLGVGGGPIIPPPVDKPPDWGTWPPQRPPHPAHPIITPPPPVDPPPVDPPTNPADPAWSWCWTPQYGWHPAFVAGDKPQPPGTAKK